MQRCRFILLLFLAAGCLTGCHERPDVGQVPADVAGNSPPDLPAKAAHGDPRLPNVPNVPDALLKSSATDSTANASPTAGADPWFHTMADAGIDFRHESGTSAEKPFPAANGSGVAALDYDLDGRYDLYFANGTPFPLDPSRNSPINRFYRNVDWWEFADVTIQSGLGDNGYGAGLTYGDIDCDGFPDVYVACYGTNTLYHNLGDGTFEPLPATAGAADQGWATSAAMLDYDNDGLLDIYVCNYGQWSWAENRWCGDRGRDLRFYCSPRTIKPVADVLLRNRGDGTFEDVAATVGLAKRLGRSQGVVAADFDDNGTIDLYIGNDLNANSMFLNQGDGAFSDASELSGVAYDYLGGMQAGMGVDAADVNGDGRPELFVTNFEGEHNAYYENLGNGLFQEVSQQRGLYAGGLPWVGWGTALADFNLDGQLDLVVTNGHVDDNRPDVDHAHPALLWQNTGHGQFSLLGRQGGQYFTQPHVGRALSLVDLDNDGDQDLVIGHQDGPPSLLRNERHAMGGQESNSVSVRLVGTRSNRDGIGSVLTLQVDDHRQVLQANGGGSYLSAHDARIVFAFAPQATEASLTIRWPDGLVTELDSVSRGGFYTVVQPSSSDMTPRVFSQGGSR